MANKLRKCTDGSLHFFCPGCNTYHTVNIDPNKLPFWKFNNDFESPTFEPSLNAKYQKNGKLQVCHSFVTDGKIFYLEDCTHHLAGRIVKMREEELQDDNIRED